MPKTTKLTSKNSSQLVARRSEGSDPRFEFKNRFYVPENPYLDVSYVIKDSSISLFEVGQNRGKLTGGGGSPPPPPGLIRVKAVLSYEQAIFHI